MTEQIDYVRTAVANLRMLIDGEVRDARDALVVAGIAQAHATLALVEQQRIANILTLVGDEDWETVEADLREFGVDPAAVRADIVAALGWSR